MTGLADRFECHILRMVEVHRFVYCLIVRSSPLKRSGMDHTVFTLQTHLVSVHQTVPPLTSNSSHLIAAYYSFIDLERMKGWIGLVSWSTADGLPIQMVTHQLQVRCRPGKVRRSETNVLPLSYTTMPHTFNCNCLLHAVREANAGDQITLNLRKSSASTLLFLSHRTVGEGSPIATQCIMNEWPS